MYPVIFLDIDGVLNCGYSDNYMPHGYVGIDEDKLLRLKQIVDATGAKIVLSSSWKRHWFMYNKDVQDEFGDEIDKRFTPHGLLPIDKTKDDGFNRGEGIHNWIEKHNITNWVVLDDEFFYDFDMFDIYPHIVKTDYYAKNGGLQDEHIKLAIDILNGKLNTEVYDEYGCPLYKEHNGLEL